MPDPECDGSESNERQRSPARPGTDDQSQGGKNLSRDQQHGPKDGKRQTFGFERSRLGQKGHELVTAGGQEQRCREQATHEQGQSSPRLSTPNPRSERRLLIISRGPHPDRTRAVAITTVRATLVRKPLQGRRLWGGLPYRSARAASLGEKQTKVKSSEHFL